MTNHDHSQVAAAEPDAAASRFHLLDGLFEFFVADDGDQLATESEIVVMESYGSVVLAGEKIVS